MNILHICSYYPTSKLYSNLTSYLDRKGINNIVYIPIKDEKERNLYNVKFCNQSKLIYSRCFSNLDRINFYNRQKKMYEKLTKIVDNEKNIDLIHAHSLFTNGYMAYKLKKEKNISYIVAVRSTDLELFFKKRIWLRKLGIEILRNASKIVFISESYRNRCIEKYIPNELKSEIYKKSFVIPNGIDDIWFENINAPKTLFKENSNYIKLIYVGQLIKRKNIEKCIFAVKELNNNGFKCKLDIVGRGPLYNKIIKEELKNKDIIKVHDFKSKEELINMYRQANIFIMPSRRETFGLVYVEAMTQGLPVIYSESEGFDRYFENGYVGFAVNNNDINDICQKVIKIKENYEEISKNCLKNIEKFKWENISDIYIDIYMNMVKCAGELDKYETND